jgi:hypothetical protein
MNANADAAYPPHHSRTSDPTPSLSSDTLKFAHGARQSQKWANLLKACGERREERSQGGINHQIDVRGK